MSDDDHLLQRVAGIVSAELPGPQCIDAVALLIETAAQFEIELLPISVSALVVDWVAKRVVCTGNRAREFSESQGSLPALAMNARVYSGTDFERQAGHMIAIRQLPAVVLDPTFSQFGTTDPAPLVVEYPSGHPELFWQTGDEAMLVRYFCVEDRFAFPANEFESVRAHWTNRAKVIADYVLNTKLP